MTAPRPPAVPAGRHVLRRLLPLALADVVLSLLALVAAFFLRFDGPPPERFARSLPLCAGLLAVSRLALLWALGLYHVQWRYASVREMLRVAAAVGLSSVGAAAVLSFLQYGTYLLVPRSVLVIELLLAAGLLGGLRLLPRLLNRLPVKTAGRHPALIYGAGDAGEQLVRDMMVHPEYPSFPAGFVDDDRAKWGTLIHGIRVLGGSEGLPDLAARTGAETLIVAMPSARASQVRGIVDRARSAGIRDIRILPGLERIVSGRVSVGMVHEVDVEDLMGREPVAIDMSSVEERLRGKRILVTGAAGSIGSELVRQVLRFSPARVALVDHDETELHVLAERLRAEHGGRLEVQVGDVRDRGRIEAVFSDFAPQAVFHAAAYKHVPMMERHAAEAVKTNVLGTRNAAEAAAQAGCEMFVLISTDKAVNPTSVMGATKRVAEMVIREVGSAGPCRFSAVRFGNVLGSRGSVVPTFREQIARGGPVTVTHPDMKRYFMTVDEACLLVLQTAALSKGGEVFVLDMGEPVLIADLAREMIRLSGLVPDEDITVEFTGVRPGEKLFEEYLTAEEGTDATRHEKIHVARFSRGAGEGALAALFPRLGAACAANDNEEILRLLRELVPTYRTPAPEPGVTGARGA